MVVLAPSGQNLTVGAGSRAVVGSYQPFSVPAQTVSDGWTNRSFTETRPDDEDAPRNEPARAGGEHASRLAQFRRGDAQ
jgi:hypothetical protein